MTALRRLAGAALGLAVVVVLLGAYVRLNDAGLGCPDWPGCYGEPLVPQSTERYPERPLEHAKAWKEMVHRYAAGGLGLAILALFLLAQRAGIPPSLRRTTRLLLGLVLFQALLGMWTVTLGLHPLVVMGHLLGGLAVASLLWVLLLQTFAVHRDDPAGVSAARDGVAAWARLALLVVVLQVALGGWTSANYAAPYCPDFPTCQGVWLPDLDLGGAFTPHPPPTGADYEGGSLDARERTTIHFVHRVGALLTLVVVGGLALRLMRRGGGERRSGMLLGAALAVQLAVGIGNVLWHFPLVLAVAHNGGALLLLLAVVAVNRPVGRAGIVGSHPVVANATRVLPVNT